MAARVNKRWRLTASVLLIAFSLCRVNTTYAISVNQWLQGSKIEQTDYIVGVLDAWNDQVSTCEKAPSKTNYCDVVKVLYEPVILCVALIPFNQVLAIVEKYIKDHPEELGRSMSSHVWNALYVACYKKNP